MEPARTSTVEGAGVELAVSERGAGPAVLFVHGLMAGADGWRPALEALAPVARAIAYDRRGHGSSGAPDPYRRTTVAEQAEDAAALLRGLGATPALLCGADLGALVCLDLLRRHPDLVRGAVLIAPPLYAFVPQATEVLAAERARLELALRESGPGAAVAAHRGVEAAQVGSAREQRAFFADYAALASWPVTRRELRAIAVPVAVLEGEDPPPHVRAAVEALVGLLPAGRRLTGADPLPALTDLLGKTLGSAPSAKPGASA